MIWMLEEYKKAATRNDDSFDLREYEIPIRLKHLHWRVPSPLQHHLKHI